jgi:hypothetical protein
MIDDAEVAHRSCGSPRFESQRAKEFEQRVTRRPARSAGSGGHPVFEKRTRVATWKGLNPIRAQGDHFPHVVEWDGHTPRTVDCMEPVEIGGGKRRKTEAR